MLRRRENSVSRLELIALVVRDYDAALRFFVEVLKFELIEDTPAKSIPSSSLGMESGF